MISVCCFCTARKFVNKYLNNVYKINIQKKRKYFNNKKEDVKINFRSLKNNSIMHFKVKNNIIGSSKKKKSY